MPLNPKWKERCGKIAGFLIFRCQCVAARAVASLGQCVYSVARQWDAFTT